MIYEWFQEACITAVQFALILTLIFWSLVSMTPILLVLSMIIVMAAFCFLIIRQHVRPFLRSWYSSQLLQ